MNDIHRLEDLLHRIHNRPYPAYRDIAGSWQMANC